MLAPFDDIQRFLMNLPADAVAVGASSREEHPQRLLSCIAGALGHDIIQGAGGLCMQLIKNAGADVQAVLGGNFTGQHLIDAAGRFIHHALDRRNDLDALAERRILSNHVDSNIKDNGGLLTVGCTGVHLRLPLAVVNQHVQRNRCAQFGLPLFLGDFHICCGVLPLGRIIFIHGAKYISDDLLLPR